MRIFYKTATTKKINKRKGKGKKEKKLCQSISTKLNHGHT